MSLWSVFRLAFLSLSRNKTRSFLTTLGIIIGVGSVITMVGLGLGAYYSVQDEISKMGTSLLMVMPGSPNSRGSMGPPGSGTNLTEDDAEALQTECPAVKYVCSVVRTSGQVIFTSQNWSTSVMGVGPNYLDVRNLKLTAGAFFTDREVRNGSKICVLGATVVKELFGGANPIGRSIRIKKMPFEVVGVLEARGQNAMGQDQDDVILAPLATIQRRMMGITHLNMIMSSAISDEMVDTAKAQMEKTLRRRHKLLETDNDDFMVRTQADMAAMASSTLGIITLLLGSIASVSLLVGGIGIMNIMLVSVTERTREIGIRMAIGAKSRDIMVQFLVEAVVLSCFGGIIGLGIGSGLIHLISYFSPWPAMVSWAAAGGAFAFSAMVGVFFGMYPAWKASQLDPIEALRFE